VEAAKRWELARGLLQRAEERTWMLRTQPGGSPGRPTMPLVSPLARAFPGGGLRRGATVSVAAGPGATSLLLALLGEASAAGAWIAVVGRPTLGLAAATEAGLCLERLALVPHPGADSVTVTAALLDGLDVVVITTGRGQMCAADRQRLAARARQRGAVLVALGSWPGADAELACTMLRWDGLGAGTGRLRSRRAVVRLRGRGVRPAGRDIELLLPGPDGRPAADDTGASAPTDGDMGAGTPSDRGTGAGAPTDGDGLHVVGTDGRDTAVDARAMQFEADGARTAQEGLDGLAGQAAG